MIDERRAMFRNPAPRANSQLATAIALACALLVGLGACAIEPPRMIQPPHPSPTVAVDYSTSAFRSPLTVTVPADVAPLPDEDTTGFVSWSGRNDDTNKIRFLIPQKYYPINGAMARPAPTDYSAHVAALIAQDATESDVTTVRVDGSTVKVATVVGLTTDSGDLGCSSTSAMKDGDRCFGLGVGYAIRLAVISHGGRTILAWARSDLAHADPLFFHRFDRMLASVTFD